MMAIVVTGGAGFIGSALCCRLSQRGNDVVVIDNLSTGRREWIDHLPGVSVIQADIRDADRIKAIITDIQPKAVCHLAAIHFIPYCIAHPQEAIEVNVVGTVNVLAACQVHPPATVVLASSAAVYPARDEPNRETDPVGPMDIYGITKQCDEQLAAVYSMDTGAAAIAVRIFNAVGIRETNPHVVPNLLEQLKQGKRTVYLGNMDAQRDYIDTRDLAEALISLLDHHPNGYDVFNVGTGKEYSVRDIVAICEKVLGCPIEVRQRTDLVRKVDRPHLCANIDKIAAVTGWQPKNTLHDTLRGLLAAV